LYIEFLENKNYFKPLIKEFEFIPFSEFHSFF